MKLKLFALPLVMLNILYARMDMTPFKPVYQISDNIDTKIKQQNIDLVKKAVEGLNQNLPIHIDNSTKLVKVEGVKNHLIYIFEIKKDNENEQELIEEGRKKVAPRVKRGLCYSAKRFLKAGVDITYIYINSSTKHQILKLDVTKKDCPNL